MSHCLGQFFLGLQVMLHPLTALLGLIQRIFVVLTLMRQSYDVASGNTILGKLSQIASGTYQLFIADTDKLAP